MSERFFPEKKDFYPQIYAYELPNDSSRVWQLKVGYTTRENVKDRVDEQIWATHSKYNIVVSEPAIRQDGTTFDDHEVHKYLGKVLNKKNTEWERFECAEHDVTAAIKWVRERNYNIMRW